MKIGLNIRFLGGWHLMMFVYYLSEIHIKFLLNYMENNCGIYVLDESIGIV